MFNEDLFNSFLETALREDIGDGDHSSLACIPPTSRGSARLLVKDEGIIAGIGIAGRIFLKIDPGLQFDPLLVEGDRVKDGDIITFRFNV